MLFDALGFRWDRSAIPTSIPSHSTERVCFRFHKMLPEFVWDASVLEGNPFTFPEVKTAAGRCDHRRAQDFRSGANPELGGKLQAPAGNGERQSVLTLQAGIHRTERHRCSQRSLGMGRVPWRTTRWRRPAKDCGPN